MTIYSKYNIATLAFFIVIMLSIIFVSIQHVTATKKKSEIIKTSKVLVIHSYNYGLDWTDEISKGIQSVLKTNDIELYYEYLDTKRTPDKDYYEKVSQFELYKLKLTKINFDVIIISDNDALRFILDYGDELFPLTPVVFCGVNNFNLEMLKGKTNFTGVSEYVDYEATLNVMMKLHPNKKRILVIVDRTSTGNEIKKDIENIIPKFADKVEFEFFQDFTLDEIESKISTFNEDYLIYLLAFNKDRNNTFISYSDIIKRIHNSTDLPIYGSWDFFMGRGIVGGMITSGFSQGEQAANLAKRIINGESINKVSIITKSPNKFMFDFNEMIHFNLKKKQLPFGSFIINKPISFFEKHEKLILTLILIILLFLSIYLIWQRRKRLILEITNWELDSRVVKQTSELKHKNKLLHDNIAELEQSKIILYDKTQKLEKALSEVKKLSGLLPICAHCKNIRDDKGYWNQIETYIKERSDADFSHAICPDCFEKLYPQYKDRIKK